MHADEVVATADQVRRLIAAQLPQWAALPIAPVTASGTDHVLFRLGEDMVVRLPRIADAIVQVGRDARWLPSLARVLPLAVPEPLALGVSGEDFPWPWSVCRWIEGADAQSSPPGPGAADELAAFLRALRTADTTGGPAATGRGGPLAPTDPEFRRSLAQLGGSPVLQGIWERALAAPPWAGPPVWTHGDLLPGNLLVRDGRLVAVIDWGVAAVGDPAVDLLCAWSVLDTEGRAVMRADVDDDTWARGRGWAVSLAVIALPYYRPMGHPLATVAARMIAGLEADAG